jgi:hypothetical protein
MLLLSRILTVVVLAALVMMVVCGIGILMRQNLARLVYVVAMAGTFLAAAKLSPIFPFGMVPHVVIYLVITAFLFSPKANEYFSRSMPADGSQATGPHLDGDEQHKSRRQIIAASILLVVAAFIAFVTFDGCGRARYRKVNGQWAWVGHSGAGRYEIKFDADPRSFVVLADPKYGRDHSHVFYEGHPILNADTDSFELLPQKVGQIGQCYAKDSHHVFLLGHQVTGADPNSFEIINTPYAHDRVRVYCGTVPMEGSDPATFEVMKHDGGFATYYIKDDFIRLNGSAFASLEISLSHPAITSVRSWAKDAKHHYRDAAMVEKADYESFHATDNVRGADRDHTYVGPFRTEDWEARNNFWKERRRSEAAKVKADTSETKQTLP